MSRFDTSVLCIQEMRKSKLPFYTTDNGFLVTSSGSSSGEFEYAGVEFIVAAWAKHAVCGFLQLDSRLTCLKFRDAGAKVGIVSAYSPQWAPI